MNYSKYLKIEKTQKGLHEKFIALVNSELQWYEDEANRLLGKKCLPAVKDDQIIQQMLPKSPADNKTKLNNVTYYTANILAYLKVCKTLLSEDFIKQFDKNSSREVLLICNYHSLFQKLLFDSIDLLNEYCVNLKKNSPIYPCVKSRIQHTMPLYQFLRQSIFGQVSFHSSIHVEPDLAISIIRQIVELRVRHAFGVLGWFREDTQSFEPLPMSTLFEVIAEHQNDIDLSMPLDCLKRIYGWSNIFIHTGIKDHSWKPLFVLEYIKEFCLGKKYPYNLNGGVVMKKAVLDQIITSLKERHPERVDVIKCKPEAILK